MNWRFKWMVVTLTFLALGIATGLLLYLLPSKKYYIESSVLLDKSGSESLLKIGSLGSDGFRRTTVYNRLATLKSNGTLARAVVHAQRDPVEFAKAETVLKARYCGPDPERTGIAGCMIRYLKNEVEATVDRNADVITIRLSTATPDAGAYLMKALLSAWVEESESQASGRMERLSQIVSKKLAEVERALAEKREKLSDFLRENPSVASDEIIEHLLKSSDEIKRDMRGLQSESAALDVNLRDVYTEEDLENVTGVAKNARREQLLASVEDEIFQDGLRILSDTKRRKVRVETSLKGIAKERAQQEKELSQLPTLLVQHKLLTVELELETGVYLSLKEKTYELQFSKISGDSGIEILSEPAKAARPHFPRLSVSLAMGVFIWLLLTGAYTLLSLKNLNFYAPGKVDGLRSAGHIPSTRFRGAMRGGTGRKIWFELVQPLNFTRLVSLVPRFERTFQFLTAERSTQARKICVIGPTQGCGKSLCSLGLALVPAVRGEGKTLLVDFDLRRVGPKHADDVESNHAGDDAVRVVVAPIRDDLALHLDVMSFEKSGGGYVTYQEALAAFQRYDTGAYKTVIFDTPPFGLFADGPDLAQFADIVVLVARDGHTTTEEMQSMFLELRLIQVDSAKIWSLQNRAVAKKADHQSVYNYGGNYRFRPSTIKDKGRVA